MSINYNILTICPVFIPAADSEAFCSAKIISAIIDYGLKISVFTLDRDLIISRWTLDESTLWDSALKASHAIHISTHKNINKSIKCSFRYQTDSWPRWIDNVIAEAVIQHTKKPFDIVYSRSLPMYAHIAGYWCSKALNVPWVANINDPWDYHLFPGSQIKVSMLSRIVSFYWLRKTIRYADLITYPCERLWKFHERLSRVKHDCNIIPHIGYSADKRSQSGLFNLVHTGKLGSAELLGRPTNALIEGIAEFLKQYPDARKITKLTLVGPKDESTQTMAKELGVEANIDTVGWVSYEDSLQYIANASVCILIENTSGEGIYLPSKITDYIASRKPVLAISPERGTIKDMLPDDGIISVEQGDVRGVVQALADYYTHYCNNTLIEKAPSDALVNQFMPHTVTNQFMTAVNGVIKNENK